MTKMPKQYGTVQRAARRRRIAAAKGPVSVVELRDAILAMIAERFEGRELDIDTATRALRQAGFDLRMAHLRTVAERSR
jgi:hypothetical protein